MSRKFKVDELLDEAEYRAYQEFLKGHPTPTIDDCFDWIAERGYKISRGAVWKHKKNFDQTLADVRQSAEMARAFSQVVKEAGVTGMNDAIISKVQQLQMQWCFAQLNGDELTPEDFERFAKAMNHMAQAAQRNEDLRKRFDEAMRELAAKADAKAKKQEGGITEEDIADVRKAIFG